MRFKSFFTLLFSLPLLAIAAPNPSGDSAATSTKTSTETKTITHVEVRGTVTSTFPPSVEVSYFPLVANTQPGGGPLPDIPNPTGTGSSLVSQILVALPSTSSTSTKSSRRSTVGVASPIGTGASSAGTVTTPIVIASATTLATASSPIATFTGGAAARVRECGHWNSGMVLVGAAVGFAAGLL